jgi:hypothetical protein
MLSGLFRNVWPLIKSGFQNLGRQAIKTGLNTAVDVVEGSTFRDAANRRIPEGINAFVSSQFPQSGSGKRRRRISKSKKHKKYKRDIFG